MSNVNPFQGEVKMKIKFQICVLHSYKKSEKNRGSGHFFKIRINEIQLNLGKIVIQLERKVRQIRSDLCLS